MIVALFTYGALNFYAAFSHIRHSPYYPAFLLAKGSLAVVAVVLLLKNVLLPTKSSKVPDQANNSQ